jgi:hypothetical protein
MQMLYVYCDVRIANVYIIKALRTLCPEGMNEQTAEAPNP